MQGRGLLGRGLLGRWVKGTVEFNGSSKDITTILWIQLIECLFPDAPTEFGQFVAKSGVCTLSALCKVGQVCSCCSLEHMEQYLRPPVVPCPFPPALGKLLTPSCRGE